MVSGGGQQRAGSDSIPSKLPTARKWPVVRPRSLIPQTAFKRYIGIDYSGAQAPEQSLPGLRAYMATASQSPEEVPPPPSPRRYWSRQEIAEWLRDLLGGRVHFWPFDGFAVRAGNRSLPRHTRSCGVRVTRQRVGLRTSRMRSLLQPHCGLLMPMADSPRGSRLNSRQSQQLVAGVEGWILGVG